MAKHKHKEHTGNDNGGSKSSQDVKVWMITAGVLFILLVFSIFTYGFRFSCNASAEGSKTQIQPTDSGPSDPSLLADLPTGKGKVKIIEFSDFECPFCGAAYGSNDALISRFKQSSPDWEPAYPRIRELVKQGLVEYEFHHFPLDFHASAQKAAEASECARDQGKFSEMHDMLYENQEALGVSDLKKYAGKLGLNMDTFNTCLDSGAKAQKVADDLALGKQMGVSGTPSFFIGEEKYNVVGAQPWSVFKELIQKKLDGETLAAPAPQEPEKPKEVNLVITSDDHVKGKGDAAITIVEYSDFECPFCGAFYGSNTALIDKFKAQDPSYQSGYPNIMSEYVDTGKVRYVFRHFPLSFHQKAMPAALASECAAEQGKFWEMHDLIFENQDAMGDDDLKSYAVDLGLDTSKFNTCLDSQKYKEKVQKQMAEGQKNGISGTPGFFINGKPISGAMPFSSFKQIIDAELVG